MAQLPVLVHEVVTRKLAAADLAGIVLHVQVQQSDLSPATRDVLPRTVIGTVAGCLVDSRRQQVPLSVLPVAVLRFESVLAITASVTTAVVTVAAVVAGIAEAAREARCRSAVLVVLARQVLGFCQRTVSRLRRANLPGEPDVCRRRRVILV